MTANCLKAILKSGFNQWLAMAERRQHLRHSLWDMPMPVDSSEEESGDA
ncbi:MAG: hypothetical protein GKR90_24400 [Pseudomonadales bacterium]|nr:hypothetical protein [Pseudomonadales bacterium]